MFMDMLVENSDVKVLATSIDIDEILSTEMILKMTPILSYITLQLLVGHMMVIRFMVHMDMQIKRVVQLKRLQTSYSLQLQPNRPGTAQFPSGLFREDYVYVGDGDLDIHNGRYCKTPEFPDGVYAYFATINSTPESSGPLNGYKKPLFPYIIGDSYKSKPISYNFERLSNTLFYNVNESKLG